MDRVAFTRNTLRDFVSHFGFGVANDNVVGRDKKSVCDFAFCRKTFAAARCAEYQAVGVFQLLSVAQNHVVGKGV